MNRLTKNIVISLILLTLYTPLCKIFYNFQDKTLITYWSILGNTYIIPNKYYSIVPPFFSDYIKILYDSDFESTLFNLCIGVIENKIVVVPNHHRNTKPEDFAFSISNKNGSFILMTKEEFKNYIDDNSILKYIAIKFNKFTPTNRTFYFDSVYKIDNNKESKIYAIGLFNYDQFILNIPILLFCCLLIVTIVNSIMYLRNYDLQSYSDNLFKAVLLDSIEFSIVNLILWSMIVICYDYLPFFFDPILITIVVVSFTFIIGYSIGKANNSYTKYFKVKNIQKLKTC